MIFQTAFLLYADTVCVSKTERWCSELDRRIHFNSWQVAGINIDHKDIMKFSNSAEKLREANRQVQDSKRQQEAAAIKIQARVSEFRLLLVLYLGSLTLQDV